MTAIMGVLGLFAGVLCGRFFKSKGYELDESKSVSKAVSFLPLIIAILLLCALIFGLKLGENAPLFASTEGPGSKHANIFISLGLATIIGIAMQRSKFCSVGSLSRILDKDFTMFFGIVAVIISATIANLAFSQYNFGFENQPIAHNQMLWNFLGMALSGFCFSLAEGCPGKHLVQMGSGNLNSAIFVMGMAAGAAIAHNFLLASSAKGITPFAPYALVLGLIFCVFVGFTQKRAYKN